MSASKISKERALAYLRASLVELDSLPQRGGQGENLDEWDAWFREILARITKIFGENSNQRKELAVACQQIQEERWAQIRHDESHKTIRRLLESYREEIEEVLEDQPASPSSKAASKKRVFLVHGRDHGPLHILARFLERLDIKPIILHEVPNLGSISIFDKFLKHSKVDYAIVILTPDDEGGPANTGKLQPRARQNVVFELGYFIGYLGKEKTCAILVQGVELPSDYEGVVYIQFDRNDGWMTKLAKELFHQGFEVDLRRIIGYDSDHET